MNKFYADNIVISGKTLSISGNTILVDKTPFDIVVPNNFNATNRTLSSVTGVTIDYNNGLLYNTGGLNTIDFYNGLLKSGDSVTNLGTSLDWNRKRLHGEWLVSEPTVNSGIANKAYVDSVVLDGSSAVSVTGSSVIALPNFTGTAGIVVITSGNNIIVSGSPGGEGGGSNVKVTGSSTISTPNFSGINGIVVITSGNNVLVSGATGISTNWNDIIDKPVTFPQIRGVVSGTTISLTTNAFDSGFVLSLGKSSLISKIETSVPAWIRLYSTTGYRSGDYSRLVTVDPTGEHGVMLEVLTTTNNKILDLAPPIICYNADGVNNIYGTVKNLSAGTTTIGISITRLILEE